MSSSEPTTSKIEEIDEEGGRDPPHEDDDDSSPDEEEQIPEAQTAGPSSTKKKKKKRSKAAKALSKLTGRQEVPQSVVDAVLDKVKDQISDEDATEENVRQALEQLKIMDVVQGRAGPGGINKKEMGSHKFWATQPVPQIGEGPPVEDGYIEPSIPHEQVRQEPYALQSQFEWTTVDIQDPNQTKELYDLLSANYVEDDDASFRFQYSAEFLHWAMCPPGYFKEWLIGVRVRANKKLVAFISGVPMTLRIRKSAVQVAEINFLCVHKKLRSKRLAPVLIKEVTRQVHLKGIFQAIYTGGIVIPTPVSTCRYYHRSINIPKLVDVRFTYVPRNMTLARMARLYKLPEQPSLQIREIEEKDIVQVTTLFTQYMRRFDMTPLMSVEEARHQFISGLGTGETGDGGLGRKKNQVVWTYVVENSETHKITDFFSFFSLPSTIINDPKHDRLEAAYLFYYATSTALGDAPDEELVTRRLLEIVGDALIVANKAQFDVFNALTLMDNVPVLDPLKFGPGDGYLNFYLYNWRTSALAGMAETDQRPKGRGVGVVML